MKNPNEHTLPPLSRLRENRISGPEFGAALSDETDAFLRDLASRHLPQDALTLVAIGGYGRRELCPHSDIDLLFLLPGDAPESLNAAIESMLYALWEDNSRKIGHAVRTAGQCAELSAEDLKAANAHLDARRLWGREDLLEEMHTALRRLWTRARLQTYVTQALEERDKRHRQFGDTRYVLEPNIKNGKGSLRDYQTLFWITDLLYGARTPEDLSDRGLMTRTEAARFRKAHDVLLTIRAHMHDVAGRAEERLHFDIQPEIARRLGYVNRSNLKAVERFMKHYFLFTRDIGDLTRIICADIDARFAEPHENKGEIEKDKKIYGFHLHGNRLDFGPGHRLDRHPIEILRLFRIAQEKGYDIHPGALRRITKNRRQINDALRRDPLAGQLFLEILTAPGGAALTLRRMNESGVLGRYLPDFGRVIALMQFDRYHMFTVDEHTLRAVDLLHRLESGDLVDGEAPPALAVQLFGEITDRAVLYMAVFLHDICKGRGGDHSVLGAELALSLCPLFGLNDAQTRLVSWLVYSHLIMSHAAFKRDLADPKTIEDFTLRVGAPERLRLLTLLTTADIMAVGPGRWNAWKAGLIEELYYKSLEMMRGRKEGGPAPASPAKPKLPPGYKPGTTDIAFEQDPLRQTTIVTITTPDRPGLFAMMAGGLSAAGANIIAARITTSEDGTAIDSFAVQNHAGFPFDQPRRLDEIRETVRKALEDGIDLARSIARQTPAGGDNKEKKDVFDTPTKIRINTTASRTNTVIEISTRDRPGLLYDMTCAMRDCGLQIRSAKITTQGQKVVDVFYVQDKNGDKLTPETQSRAKETLKRVLDTEPKD